MIMKKLVTALALCAAVSTYAAVESQNIVGYKSDIMLAGANFSMLSSPFAPVGGGSGIPINSLFTDNSIFTASDTADTADWIIIWENGAYRLPKYFYSSDAGNTWASGADSFTTTTDTIPTGTAFWLYRQNIASTNATVAGQVITTNLTVNVVGANFTMVANPFPAPMSIAAITGADLTASDTADTADWIIIWENGAYRLPKYFYSSDAGNTWASGADSFTTTTDKVPAGGGFWFYRKNAGTSTLTLPCPY
jgi:hypothetical protein